MAAADTELLARVAHDQGLRAYLEALKTSAVRTLVEATDMVAIHRAQGQYLFASRQLDVLDKAKDLR